MDARDNQKKQYEVKITRHAEQSMREIAVYIAVDLAEPGTAVKKAGSKCQTPGTKL